jgi:hypothetical protein
MYKLQGFEHCIPSTTHKAHPHFLLKKHTNNMHKLHGFKHLIPSISKIKFAQIVPHNQSTTIIFAKNTSEKDR